MNKLLKNQVKEMIRKEVEKRSLVYPVDASSFNLKKDNLLDGIINIMTEMAYWESGYDADKVYIENFDDSKGEPVVSTGLFQLSVESVNGYGLNYEHKDLKDPQKNVEAAVVIFIKWLNADRCISKQEGWFRKRWLGPARYWSVLRGNSSYTKKALRAIKKVNK